MCIAGISCGAPGGGQFPPNLRLTGSPTYLYSDVVRFSCPEGFLLLGDAVLRCLASGEWAGSLPTCSGELMQADHFRVRQYFVVVID